MPERGVAITLSIVLEENSMPELAPAIEKLALTAAGFVNNGIHTNLSISSIEITKDEE